MNGTACRVMGIINVTPDSFSDGGLFLSPEAAIRRGLEMFAAGAAFLDIGGESTRPGAAPIDREEEWLIVVPGPQADFIFAAILPCFAKISAACPRQPFIPASSAPPETS